jgi:hypothetical protein
MEIKKFRVSLYCIIPLVFTTLIIFSLLLAYGYKYNNINRVFQIVAPTATPSPNFVKALTGGAIHPLQDDNINKAIMRVSYISLSKDTFLTYTNPTYGIKIEYPYSWIIDDSSYPQGKGGVQIAAFYLPNASKGLPIIRIGIDNLTKEFPERQGKVDIFDYLKKALEGKNSKGFPGFKLIEYNLTTTTSNSTLAGNHLTYKIIWTYTHPTYGIRKSIEVGTVIGNKGYFIDYTSNISKFSNYLQVVQKVISSLDIINNNKSSHQLQVNEQMQQI